MAIRMQKQRCSQRGQNKQGFGQDPHMRDILLLAASFFTVQALSSGKPAEKSSAKYTYNCEMALRLRFCGGGSYV